MWLRQLRALIKKNYLIKVRNKWDSYFEILLPLIICIIIFVLNMTVGTKENQYQANYYKFCFVLTAAIPILLFNTCRFILYQVVKEKEINVLNTLITLNMQSRAYGLSFVITQSFYCLYQAIILTLSNLPIMDSGYYLLFFLDSFLFGITLLFFSLTLTTFYRDTKFSTQIGILLLFFPVVIFFGIVLYMSTDRNIIIYTFFWIPHFPSLQLMQEYIGAFLSVGKDHDFVLNQSLLLTLQLINVPIHILLYLYLDQVITNNNGVLFFFKNFRSKKALIKKKMKMNNQSRNFSKVVNSDVSLLKEDLNEEDVVGINIIQIEKLTKSYNGCKVLNDFSLTISQDEIICLIGNNGAGKTTLINILIGLVKPDKGDAKIFGHSLEHELYKVRKNLRVCQQFDFLFQELTPKEHVELIYEIKGLDIELRDKKITEILKLVNLHHERNQKVKYLSGGQKRKLSLGIALIGDTKFIILDEPTAFLDHQSREEVWNIIRKIRKGRALLITTQHIEEADILADKICVLKNGAIVKFDTSANLKKEHCYGYKLTVSPKFQEQQELFQKQLHDIKEFILKFIPNAFEPYPQPKNSLQMMLPFKSQLKIANLLEELIRYYPDLYPDITMNSLEDAYLHIYNENINQYIEEVMTSANVTMIRNEDNLLMSSNRMDVRSQQYDPVIIENKAKPIDQFKTLFRLRLEIFKRNKSLWMYLAIIFIPHIVYIFIAKYLITFEIPLDILMSELLLVRLQIFIYCLGSGIFIFFLISDFQTQKRNFLRLLGLNNRSYYLSYFLFDYLFYFIPATIICIESAILNIHEFNDKSIIKYLSIIALGIVIIPLIYIYSFIFKDQENAFKTLGMILFTFGFLIANILNSVTINDFYNISDDSAINLIFMIDPFIFQVWTQAYTETNNPNNLTNFIAQLSFCFLQILIGIGILALTIILDNKRFNQLQSYDQKTTHKNFENNQTEHSSEAPPSTYSIQVIGLSKIFRNYQPVINNVSFKLTDGQILGIIGPNGAGKSTLFNIITMMLPRTNGSVFLLGEDITTFNNKNCPSKFGIVSQNNILWDDLTIKEHLQMVGRMQGLDQSYIDEQSSLLIEIFQMSSYTKKQVKYLSGGNRRKLCIAMALLTKPSLILLDEPTAGLDPLSRRNLFNYIRQLRDSTVILITQRIDEVEKYCDQIAFMLNGQFKDIGDVNYLQEKHGDGYILNVFINNQHEKDDIDSDILQQFPFCKKVDENSEIENGVPEESVLTYNFDSIEDYLSINIEEDIRIKVIYLYKYMTQMIENNKIKDFSIHRSSLEQIFNKFVQQYSSINPTTQSQQL